MEYLLHILVMICIYIILAVSLDLLVGHTGLLTVVHGGFYGLGAYSSALLSVHFGVPFPLGITVGIIIAILVSLLVSIPSLRLRDDYFVIATFGFQMIVASVLNNWIDLTRGPLGISNIPQPTVLGWVVQSRLDFVVLAALVAAFSYVLVTLITTSPFGRVLRAIREDEILARALGKNALRFKVAAFGVSAALAAVAGSLYAHYITYIDPSSFTIMESILVISMVVIGGAGSRWGPVIGAVTLVVFPEVLRLAGLPSSIAANVRQIFYGIMLVGVVMIRPRGLVGRYGFGR